ncbi:M48 family metallopeptidase [bacterium]|nr:M48 family metallopeptidase [bacterium]
MTTQMELGGITVDVVLKDIKNIHLSVYPPAGRVRISAPARMKLETIRVFAISKLSWIKLQQKKLRGQERETPREYVDRESHYVWGKRYLLAVAEEEQAPFIELQHRQMLLHVRPCTSRDKKHAIVEEWYREQIKKAVPPLLAKCEPLLGVKVKRFFVQRMKTKWGSCNHRTHSIRLNTELAKKPYECLEYIVVHEMVHLLESTHNERFFALLDQFMPNWRHYRAELNRAPLGHVMWEY